MYAVQTEEFYVMDMLDYSEWNPEVEPSLDKMVTEIYGRKYVGQQTGDMLRNDSQHIYSMRPSDVEQWVCDDESFEEYRHPASGELEMLSLRKWLDTDPADFKYDFEHYRLAPGPEIMLAYLIRDGHLPYGTYLLKVMW